MAGARMLKAVQPGRGQGALETLALTSLSFLNSEVNGRLALQELNPLGKVWS